MFLLCNCNVILIYRIELLFEYLLISVSQRAKSLLPLKAKLKAKLKVKYKPNVTSYCASLYQCLIVLNCSNTAHTESDSEMEDLTAEMTKVVSEEVSCSVACYVSTKDYCLNT